MSELTDEHINRVLIQMKERGLSYDDFWAEYYDGTNTTYGYDRDKQCYICTMIDIIAASFIIEEEISEAALKERLLECGSLQSFREQGFKL